MKKTLITIFILLGFLKIQAQNPYQPVNENRILVPSFQFQSFTLDPRSAGLGNASIALSPDANSPYFNPSKLVFLNETISCRVSSRDTNSSYFNQSKQIFLNDRNDGIKRDTISSGISLNYVPYAPNLIEGQHLYSVSMFRIDEKRNEALSLVVKYFNAGNVPIRDNVGNLIENCNNFEYSLAGAWSKKVSEKSALSVGAKYTFSSLTGKIGVNGIEANTASALAFDLYYFHNGNVKGNKNSWLNYAFTLTNIGSKIQYKDYTERNFQPTTFKAGMSQNFIFGKQRRNNLQLTLEAGKLLIPTPPIRSENHEIIKGTDEKSISGFGTIWQSWGTAPDGFSEHLKEITYSVGGEFTFHKFITGRAGYFYQNPEKGNLQFFTVGLGAKVKRINLNVSYLITTKTNPTLQKNMWSFGLAYLIPRSK